MVVAQRSSGPANKQTETTAAVCLQGVTVGYDHAPVLTGADLAISWGQLVGVIGPNGAGKSTLLKTILGTLRPRSGTVTIGGHPAPSAEARNSIGYVPQREVVNWDFPVTVRDVVLMGRTARLGLLRFPGSADRQATQAALERVGMADLAGRQISQLSGGQQQRVFLARALAQGGNLLLLDEPLNGVDVTTQDTIGALLHAHAAAGGTVLLATHDLELAAAWCSQIVLVNHAIVAYGAPPTVLQPDLLRAAYGGHVLVLPGGGPAPAHLLPDDHGHPGGRPPPTSARPEQVAP